MLSDDRMLSYDEFVNLTNRIPPDTPESLVAAFRALDRQNKQYLDLYDLKLVQLYLTTVFVFIVQACLSTGQCFRPFDRRHPHRQVDSLGAFTVICINSALQITPKPNCELQPFLRSLACEQLSYICNKDTAQRETRTPNLSIESQKRYHCTTETFHFNMQHELKSCTTQRLLPNYFIIYAFQKY